MGNRPDLSTDSPRPGGKPYRVPCDLQVHESPSIVHTHVLCRGRLLSPLKRGRRRRGLRAFPRLLSTGRSSPGGPCLASGPVPPVLPVSHLRTGHATGWVRAFVTRRGQNIQTHARTHHTSRARGGVCYVPCGPCPCRFVPRRCVPVQEQR